ncbi:hypothetical protein C2845_PM07G24750 [Panicum miliaceum]|uniref:Uncharacterized protein n=1 Tax=Panicum miliaceum TaxID=4540 RepID=A0A3L6SPQ4_PANMI|nr:hypothetical protein C2845_PM07G24750 [Panicum miliaceum]
MKRPLLAGAGSMAGALLFLLILLCPFAEETAAAAGSGSCVFASSSSSTVGYNPASTATPLSSSSGSDSGSPVLNASGAGSSEPSEFSPDIPGAVDMDNAWRLGGLVEQAGLAEGKQQDKMASSYAYTRLPTALHEAEELQSLQLDI